MSYAFIWNRAVFYCRMAVSAGWENRPADGPVDSIQHVIGKP